MFFVTCKNWIQLEKNAPRFRVLCSLEGEQGAVGVVVLAILRWLLTIPLRLQRAVQQRDVAIESMLEAMTVACGPAVFTCLACMALDVALVLEI